MRSVDPKSSAPIGLVRATMVASAVAAAAASLPGCVSDPDCGICDPENLILETIAASNYAGKQIYVLSPDCEGQACPEPLAKAKFYVTDIGQCLESEDALDSPRGPEEWCKISPLVVGADGINFVFNNLLDPQSIELVRKQLTNPQLFEVYDWKTRILKITGPATRYNGDYYRGSNQNPDVITRAVSLSCIDNLAQVGQAFNHEVLAANPQICDDLYQAGGKFYPWRTALDIDLKATTGKSDWRSAGNSCDSPEDGPDTCCTSCDYELAVNVGRYGGTAPFEAGGAKNPGPAIACDTMEGDKFVQCEGFIPWVDRSADDPNTYRYTWGDQEVTSSVPMVDRLRETHPDLRPAGAEQKTVSCDKDSDCTNANGSNLPGTECVGHFANNPAQACSKDSDDDACVEKRCIAEWFVSCESTEFGGQCVDKRFSDSGVAGCFVVGQTFTAVNSALGESRVIEAGRRLAYADLDENGEISAEEGCASGLADCDPLNQGFSSIRVYDRKRTLPEQTRDCICTTDSGLIPDYCADTVSKLCYDEQGQFIEARRDQYATKFVTVRGGVIYDPAVKGVQYEIADLGGVGRALVEACAQGRARIGALNVKDGWRANDAFSESNENYDRAMCSSSRYEIQFAVPEDGEGTQYIKDKVGNTLSGRRTYTFETPDFHVVPGSGFPTDNLRIGACDDFEIGFSNKYDMSLQNLRKIQIVRLLPGPDDTYTEAEVVAGGITCTDDPDAVTPANPPCLTVNVRNQAIGKVGLFVNPKDYGQVLKTGERYRVKVPGLGFKSYEEFTQEYAKDPATGRALYQAAFWDACGMPLILGGTDTPDFNYDFTIDPPKAKEDEDGTLGLSLVDDDAANSCDRLGDSVQISCDNASKHFNPDQLDTDLDGFGDIVDLCPTIETAINTADSDKDGVGNECDTCSKQASAYNKEAAAAGVPPELLVRNTPFQSDWDGDGVGDACDNCVKLPNCGDFGNGPGQTPWELGKQAPIDNTNICQTDIDALKMIGDACVDGGVPITYEGAAGPVGFGNDDDFDGDGLRNLIDYCPRIPIEKVACNGDDECGGNKCTEGVCNHPDGDGDKVGDACDTCPFDSNPEQIADGGMQEDDQDQDFVGRRCETNPDCYNRTDPRPFSFYDVSVNGFCCTVVFDEISKLRALREPYELQRDESGTYMIVGGGRVLKPDCAGDPNCRALPEILASRPGVTTLPQGCEQALIDAGYDPANKVYAKKLTLADVGGDELALWSNMCFLPQFDQDFDGIGDVCDLCPFAFDPNNEPYINENQRLFPDAGKYCNGAYDVDQLQKAIELAQPLCYEAEGDTDTGGTDTGGTDTGGTDTGG